MHNLDKSTTKAVASLDLTGSENMKIFKVNEQASQHATRQPCTVCLPTDSNHRTSILQTRQTLKDTDVGVRNDEGLDLTALSLLPLTF